METRVAVLAVIVQEGSSVQALNELLHQYGPYIIGRMGVPYRERGVNIISVALDAPNDIISALSGKLGRLDGISSSSSLSPPARGIPLRSPRRTKHRSLPRRRPRPLSQPASPRSRGRPPWGLSNS